MKIGSLHFSLSRTLVCVTSNFFLGFARGLIGDLEFSCNIQNQAAWLGNVAFNLAIKFSSAIGYHLPTLISLT